MRVLHVTAVAERGGLEVVLLNILGGLDRSRFIPEVLLLEHGPFVREVEQTGTETHVIPSGRVRDVLKGWKAIARIVDLIRSQEISIVHSHNPKAHIYGGLAAAITGVPALLHLHGVPRFAFTREGMLSLMSVAVPARRTLACSAYLAQAFRRAWHSKREIRVIHNGVSPYVPSVGSSLPVREEFGISDTAPIIVMATRLQRWKGVHVLLDAAALVVKDKPEACFVIVGGTLLGLEEGYAPELQRQVEHLKLSSAVRFAGFQADVFRFYSAADLVVHCSIEPEPFGMVLVEAMACGKPIVASDCGGPREIVESDVTGLLVPPNDAKYLAQAILALLANPDLRARMGQAGVARVRSHFTANRMVAQLHEVYEGMVLQSRTPRLGPRKNAPQ